ncbi:thiol:disulfide interchange protein DsbA/DsbL [Thiothrix subterranea]|uniref:Thiol:disulfide interchange protein n=1 Tax=Thiothrix subterranea TaxID=2735563 RepID=A0AA51R4Z4_9GAMM|nr:thiol:disulfide interchange protein DsbA/DsbL [Thiothrix subterranea]MDQ5769758.1 thiol:disulfide interchange protein DsbA/DsbL [Thiothrix subterranea]QQZ29428.1 thiol:disulfide interchange protein DsbA/DsbL [Thiothrix subterranea]WML87215.1 thiol:disulfide interchange protein DsbA/DsbL [Thiothrix subterranea]
MKRTLSHTLGFMMAALFALTGCIPEASQAQDFKEGTHYVTLPSTIPTQAAEGKVEVVDLFWYGCPHCYSLEPTIEKFLSKKPDNVVFQRVPATLSPRWEYHAKLFYVGQMLDADGSKRVHTKIFEALQKQRRKINDDEAMTRFFTELGFTADQVKSALNSMEMKTMMARAKEVGEKSKADSVPVIIVNGKYRTSPSMVGSEETLLQVVDYLVKRETK